MRSKSFVVISLLMLFLLAAAGATYAYDQSRTNRLAEGIRIDGIDVGGMTTAQARARLDRDVLAPLNEPVVVSYKGRRFRLTPTQSRVGVDIDATIDRALARSRKGSILSRTLRGLTGGEVRADLPLSITYDRAAVDRLVERVKAAVDRPAVDAAVHIEPSGVSSTPSRDGRALDTARLARSVNAKVTSPTGSKRVRAVVRTVKPKVSDDQIADKYPAILIVNRGGFKLSYYRGTQLVKTYGIAVGRVGLETPAGLYHIQNKAIDPAWHVPDSDWAGDLRGKTIPGGVPENPIKARWMGIFDGAGIHGTDAEGSIGTAASHGCIRMRIPEVKELYDKVPVGALVLIV